MSRDVEEGAPLFGGGADDGAEAKVRWSRPGLGLCACCALATASALAAAYVLFCELFLKWEEGGDFYRVSFRRTTPIEDPAIGY